MEKYYSVEQISKLLDIHPKTIQRYIREGKLRANKVGKSWRVTGHDLSVFAESDKKTCAPEDQDKGAAAENRIRVSSVIDISVCDKQDAIRIVDMLTAVQNSKPPEYGNASVYTQYIVEESKLRITLWSGIHFAAVIMNAIAALTEQNLD